MDGVSFLHTFILTLANGTELLSERPGDQF
jgi:hypothetical protein